MTARQRFRRFLDTLLMMDYLAAYWTQLTNFLAFDAARLTEPAMMLRLSLQVCLMFGSAFFSSSETALFSLSDVDLDQLRRQRHPRADGLHDLLSQPRRLIISILCGNELINIAATTNMAGVLLALYGGERAGLVNVMVMVPLLLLFGEITPKTIAVSNPVEVSSRIICAPMNLWVRTITPIRWLIRIVADRITTWIVGEARDADHILRISEFRSLVADIEEEGLLSATDRVLVYNLLDAGNTEVVHIMTPRTQMHFVELECDMAGTVDALIRHRLLRMPVYEDTRDNIRGFIHVEDVTEKFLDGKDLGGLTCRDVVRPPLLVPLTKSIDGLLDVFQAQQERAAVILNEHGGVSGMVTIEDVVNFIFEEIAGEFPDQDFYTRAAPGVYVVSGHMKLGDFEALTNFGIEDPRMTTIGGVLLRYLGRLPKIGDTVTIEDIKMTVLEMEGNRVSRLRVSKTVGAEEDTPTQYAEGDGSAPSAPEKKGE